MQCNFVPRKVFIKKCISIIRKRVLDALTSGNLNFLLEKRAIKFLDNKVLKLGSNVNFCWLALDFLSGKF